MNQEFTKTQLKKLLKYGELDRANINEQTLNKEIDIQFENILKDAFDFDIKKLNNHFKVYSFAQLLLLRKLNDNLKRIYKDTQSNRDIITKQISVLLEETCPFWILKTDIKSFYENVNRNLIIDKLERDNLLSYYSIFLIKKLFSNKFIKNENGLPRGISISSTLSEIYMRKFDKWCVQQEGVYFYARFVDDIILFSYQKELLYDIRNKINNILFENNNLEINKNKTDIYYGDNIHNKSPLEYLGYKFLTDKIKRNKKEVAITISDKNVKKIKSRIIYVFLDYLKSNDFNLLQKRLKFLTGNHSIRNVIDGNNLKAGIYYNYKLVNNTSVFEELDNFYRKVLYSKKTSLGKKIYSGLNTRQKNNLNKYSFKFGFTNRLHKYFTPSDLKKIVACWK